MNTGRTDFVAESSYVAGSNTASIFDVSVVRPGEDAFNIGVTETFPLTDVVRVGADPLNEIVLDGRRIARLHATFEIGAGGPRLVLSEDAEATVGDRVVRGVVGLLPGQDILIGRNRLTLRFRDESLDVESDWELMSRDGQASLHLVDEISIGQSETCDLQLVEDQVCERHARLVPMQGMLWVQDLSDGDTFVNGDPVAGARLLQHGDVVRFATAGFKVIGRGPRAEVARPEVASVSSIDARRPNTNTREEFQEHSESLFWQTLKQDPFDQVDELNDREGVAPGSRNDEPNLIGEPRGERARVAQHPRPVRRSAGSGGDAENLASPARVAPEHEPPATPAHVASAPAARTPVANSLVASAPAQLLGGAFAQDVFGDSELDAPSEPRRQEPDTIIEPRANSIRVSAPWVRGARASGRRSTGSVWFLAIAVAIAAFAWAPVVVKTNPNDWIDGSAVDRVKALSQKMSLPIVQWYRNQIAETSRSSETWAREPAAPIATPPARLAPEEVAGQQEIAGPDEVVGQEEITALQRAATEGDAAAANRLREVRQGYVEQATEALQRGDVTRAPALLRLAAMIEPSAGVTPGETSVVADPPRSGAVQIDGAISRAHALAAAGISTFPASDQEVVKTLVAALRVEPNNLPASEALSAVVGALVGRIETHLSRHQFADATDLLSAIRDAGVRVDALSHASDRPTFVDATLWKALSVANLLVEADRMIQRRTIVATQGDSALSLLERALLLDPGNAIAVDMGMKSAGLLFQAARRAEESGQRDESRRLSEIAALVLESTSANRGS